MAELLFSRYIPSETFVTRRDSTFDKELLNLNYEFKELTDSYYQFTKPPMLEMVFREGENDFVISNMLDELQKVCPDCKDESAEVMCAFVEKVVEEIAKGKIKITILPDGSYTMNNVKV